MTFTRSDGLDPNMAAALMMLLFLFKSKYRRKSYLCGYTLCVLSSLVFVVVIGESKNDCGNFQCVHGVCKNGTCVCNKGWQGSNCEFCGGRLRLTNESGFITDGPGNYSFDIQCTWLIETESSNSTLRLRLEHFATECSWDHLYIFDGDSVFSPLLAAYSGLVLQDPHPGDRVPEVVASSGMAFLHFFSDVAYNMTGFNISYRTNSCPQNCSGQGVCLDGVCTCDAERTGKACETPICPSDCGKGTCNREGHRCECKEGFRGLDCTQSEMTGYWIPVVDENPPLSRASHQAVNYNGSMWVFGGETFEMKPFQVLRFNIETSIWEEILSNSPLQPKSRYGHSIVTYKDKVYMFGGVLLNGTITDELWTFDFSTHNWLLVNLQQQNIQCLLCAPLAVVGHTATVVDNKMIVIFGHSPEYGYASIVQEYEFGPNKWHLVNTTGAIVKGGYGHTSIYDNITENIYVHGGYHSVSLSSQTLSSVLYKYDPHLKTWHLLTPGKVPRYLHAAALINGMMLIFGGNTHNDTSRNLGAKCYSTDFLAYDINCDIWYDLSPPFNLFKDIARFGHSAIENNGSVYFFGGFNGRLLNDIIKYTPGNCESYKDNSTCVKAHPGIKCVWNKGNSLCESLTRLGRNYETCPQRQVNYSSLCEAITSCSTCLHTSYNCIWCGNFCSHTVCKESSHKLFGLVSNGLTLVAISPYQGPVKTVKESNQCDPGFTSVCSRLHNCQACQILGNCSWEADKECYPISRSAAVNQTEKNANDVAQQCSVPCSERRTCENCTNGHCIWCGIKQRCVESNAYVASFPYGQCMEWTTQLNKCPAHTCSEIKTCEKCHENPKCGWCDDASGTGLGRCLEGGSKGPIRVNNSRIIIDHNECPHFRWYFTDCPECQCNGHSTCNESSVCVNCLHLTEGPHCEFCINGYYGDPTNGGNCTACDCNHHSPSCHRETGKCFCTTKGITGNHCDRCDEQNHYYGDPRDGGTCFYDLTIDFQFTFNMSKPDDRHYSQINFKNTPTKQDIDADFSILCSLSAYINISVKTASKPEKLLFDNHHCSSLKKKFSHSEYSFGTEENTTFYVYVYNFQPPLSIQIAFAQQPKLDLLQFFITFSSCFLSLLIIAAILWKIKQKYDLYRRRQRLFVEMEQMASRPFASVLLEMERKETAVLIKPPPPTTDNASRKKKKDRPSPIALEPCFGNRAAVLSLIVRLPTGDEIYTPPGQSGIAIASALVTLGNPRKQSTDTHKGDFKGKGRKHVSHQHPDTCI